MRDGSWPGSGRDKVGQAGDDADGGHLSHGAEHVVETLHSAALEDLGGLKLRVGPATGLVHMGVNV